MLLRVGLAETNHVVRDSSIDVSSMQIEGAEHDPCPKQDSKINLHNCQLHGSRSNWKLRTVYLPNKSSLFLGRPFNVWIKPVTVLIPSLLILQPPVISSGRIAKDVLSSRAQMTASPAVFLGGSGDILRRRGAAGRLWVMTLGGRLDRRDGRHDGVSSKVGQLRATDV